MTEVRGVLLLRNWFNRLTHELILIRATTSLWPLPLQNTWRLHTWCETLLFSTKDQSKQLWQCTYHKACRPIPAKIGYPTAFLTASLSWRCHAPFMKCFRDCICDVLCNLPYDKYTLCVKVEMNLPFQSLTDGFTATADLILFLSSLTDFEIPEIPVIIECAFFQDCTNLWNKIKKEIDVHPKVTLLVAILVMESPSYHRPEEDSDA